MDLAFLDPINKRLPLTFVTRRLTLDPGQVASKARSGIRVATSVARSSATSLQMMQQWTGVNFIFYVSISRPHEIQFPRPIVHQFGTRFFVQLGSIKNLFLISLITALVNVFSAPISFWTIERFGRRPLLIYGALGMLTCQFLVAIIGTAISTSNTSAISAIIAFICISIFFFRVYMGWRW
jgi:MFS family permease